MAKARTRIEVTPSNRNVFGDLGFDRPEEELARAKLAIQIWKIIGDRKLTQMAAGKLTELDQSKVSALLNGHLVNFFQ